MSRVVFWVAPLALIVGAGLLATADDKKELPAAAVCPSSGEHASADISIDYRGKKLYFCCPGCAGYVQKNIEKFAAKANHQLYVTGQMVQVACPYSGREINPESTVEVSGVTVGFCCNNCKGKTEGADDAVALVFADTSKGFTLQTACPVSGRPIDTAAATDHEGRTVYFCCNNCKAAFEKDPSKFAGKLPEVK